MSIFLPTKSLIFTQICIFFFYNLEYCILYKILSVLGVTISVLCCIIYCILIMFSFKCLQLLCTKESVSYMHANTPFRILFLVDSDLLVPNLFCMCRHNIEFRLCYNWGIQSRITEISGSFRVISCRNSTEISREL